eukprot:4302896-Pyramimonas_sp.AAC.1
MSRVSRQILLLAQAVVAHGHAPLFPARSWPRIRFHRSQLIRCICQSVAVDDTRPSALLSQ